MFDKTNDAQIRLAMIATSDRSAVYVTPPCSINGPFEYLRFVASPYFYLILKVRETVTKQGLWVESQTWGIQNTGQA